MRRSCRRTAGFLTRPAGDVGRESWKASQYVFGGKAALRPRQFVRLAALFGISGSLGSRAPSIRISAPPACARCVRCNVHDISSSACVDIRQHKGNFRLPGDFWLKDPVKTPSPLDNCSKPGWVDAQPCTLVDDARMDNHSTAIFPAPWSLSSEHAVQLIGPGLEKRFFLTPDFVKKLCQQGQVKGAVEALEVLVGTDSVIDKYLFYSVLKECVVNNDPNRLGGQVHALAVKRGFGSDTFLCNHFIRMYAAHGELQKAMDVFTGVSLPDTFMWSSIISAHVKQGQAEKAIQLYQHMRATRVEPDAHVLVAALKACAAAGDLHSGKAMHGDALTSGLEHNMFVRNCLVDMYAKCGSLEDARAVFDRFGNKDVVTWNAMIAGYAKAEGMAQEALSLFSAMRNDQGSMAAAPDAVTFVSLLQACANVGVSVLEMGKQLHLLLKEQGLEESDVVVGGSLVNMYCKCGSVKDAELLFHRLPLKNVVTWNAMIHGYVQQEGMAQEALTLYSAMCNQGMVAPNAVTYTCLLQACANVGMTALATGRHLHFQLKDQGLGESDVVSGSLVNMYVKCGSLKDARTVFDGISSGEKNVVTWTSIIAGYAQQEGMGQEALDLYSAMQNGGMTAPDAVTFICLLQACANVGPSALDRGKQLHSQLLLKDREYETDVVVGGSLVNMYAKCGSLNDARIVFDKLGQKNVLAWNAMIAGYSQEQVTVDEAFSLYGAMPSKGVEAPDAVTFVYLLQACAKAGDMSALEKGKQLHVELMERGLEHDVAVGGSLVNMYMRCGSLNDARSVFDGLREKNVVTWTAMIAGYAQEEGMGQEALSLYSAMHNEGAAAPNTVTFACLLQACANVGMSALDQGKQLHSHLKDRRLESDVLVSGSLVNMYAKCGSLKDARLVFDGLHEKNVVTWTTMIAAYAQQEGMGQEALRLYSAMHNEGLAVPDAVTFACLLQACANVGVSALELGKQLHSQLLQVQSLERDVVVGGGLVNMYVKCGSLEDARIVFDALGEKTVVTWNAMIAGYAQQEAMGQEALNIYFAMRNGGLATPDAVTYVCLLEACASVGALQQGKQLHSEIREGGLDCNVLIGTCLVKMYAKCGRLEVSRGVFDGLPVKDLVTWTALLKGYAEHGEGGMAIQCFEELLKQGIQPDEATYTCLFAACSRSGLVDQGQQYFETMLERHGVQPNDQHYCCMVDLLGRSGHLDRAEQMLRASGLAGNSVSWTALLSACKSYGDAEIGRRCFDQLVELEPTIASAYVLLSSIYANAGRWDEVSMVEKLRKVAGARKKPAKACIEVKEEVHEFTVGEERSDVAATLRKMNLKMKQGGHVPQTQLVLRALSEQEKEDALCGHAEKLALAYGLLNTPAGSALVVTKNLRMCNDCHSSTKIMSRLEKREIVVRDGHKVHRFTNGACSCRDRQ